MGDVRPDHRGFYQATPSQPNSSTPSHPNSSLNLLTGANANGSGSGFGRHQAQQSYSSTNTDGDGAYGGYGAMGQGDRSDLLHLEEGDASHAPVQSGVSEGSAMPGSQTGHSTLGGW